MTRVLFLCALFLLQGCTQWRYDIGEPVSQYPADVGSTLADAILVLGPPLRTIPTASGYVMAWEHWQISENSVGLSLGFLGVDSLSVDWGEASITGEFLLLAFNPQHTLVGSEFSRFDSEAGGGAALQPLASLVDVVDVGDLTEALPQHRWGAVNLQALPTALNAVWQPELGGRVLEQRGTPNGIGQRSVENQ
ncbi:hypothetical protein [Parahalioglobus pacificus]|uniref:hypothetical protein n=1 Tax=Parahalioglobus pacificus TaxID=930806 RepID=UPI00167B9F5D|nr:hypothetical protein [Halioglobus pacificus]